MEKVCVKCNLNKPVSDFYPKERGIFGVRADCKECWKAYQHSKTAAFKENKLFLQGLKVCYGCKKTLDISSFHKNSLNKSKLNGACKSCCRIRSKKNYTKFSQKILDSGKRWRANNKQRMKELQLEWVSKNQFKRNANEAKRRSHKLQQTPVWADLDKITKFYENCPPGYHVDHIIPLNGKTVRGLHVHYNLQYLPAVENIRKGNRLVTEGGYSNR